MRGDCLGYWHGNTLYCALYVAINPARRINSKYPGRNHPARQAFDSTVITGFLRVPSFTTGISQIPTDNPQAHAAQMR
jgi:hypothetical protein